VNHKIPLSKPYFRDDELERINAVLESGCVAGTCAEVGTFETKFANMIGVKHAIATTSCMTALHTAMLSIGIGPGDEVIVPAFTHPATGYAPLHCGAKTVIVDVYSEDYTMCVQHIIAAITDKTKAICPVYMFGLPPDIAWLEDVAEDNDLKVIYDTATGLGATYEDMNAGNFGDAECFSFFPTKNITTGEGGMITTNDDEIAATARELVDFGLCRETGEYKRLGYNYRMSAVNAAMGIAQLDILWQSVDEKQYLKIHYDNHIGDEDMLYHALVPQEDTKHVDSAAQRYVCIVNPDVIARDTLTQKLRAAGIGCTFGANNIATIATFANENECRVAERLYRNSIALPLYYGMTTDDVDTVLSAICKILKETTHTKGE
jgi:dTDP-4-amino-4,6-dideoxygalactose transaminase